MDGWMDGMEWNEGGREGQTYGPTDAWMEGRTEGQRMDGWMEGGTDGCIDGRTDGWMEGRRDSGRDEGMEG